MGISNRKLKILYKCIKADNTSAIWLNKLSDTTNSFLRIGVMPVSYGPVRRLMQCQQPLLPINRNERHVLEKKNKLYEIYELTVMVDRALKINYLTIYLSIYLSTS